MSVRHKVTLALSKHEPGASYAHEVYYTDKMAYFVFEQDRSAEIVIQMLRIMLGRKPPLIHNGKKPR